MSEHCLDCNCKQESDHVIFGIVCIAWTIMIGIILPYAYVGNLPVLPVVEISFIIGIVLIPICFLWNKITNIIKCEDKLK